MAFPLSDEEHAAIKARIDSQDELIVAAAIRDGDVIVMVERPVMQKIVDHHFLSRGIDVRRQQLVELDSIQIVRRHVPLFSIKRVMRF